MNDGETKQSLLFRCCLGFDGCVEYFSWEEVNTRYCEPKEKVSRVKATSLSILIGTP